MIWLKLCFMKLQPSPRKIVGLDQRLNDALTFAPLTFPIQKRIKFKIELPIQNLIEKKYTQQQT